MTSATGSNRLIKYKRLKISLGVIAALFVLLVLLSYFWLPGYAKSQLEIKLTETLDRPVTVQSIEIKPHSMELAINGFRVGEKNSVADEAFLSFDRLYVDISINSVVHRAPVVSAITLTGPNVRLVRETEEQFNISDLIEKFSKDDDEVEDTGETLFSISNIIIEGGQFELVDQFKQSHQSISDINLGIPFVANLKNAQEAWVEPHFSAKVNGAPLSLDGNVRPFTDKREATLDLKLTDIDLTNIKNYLPFPTKISLLSGKFDSDLELVFSQTSDEPQEISLVGNVALRQFEIDNSAVEEPYHVTLERLDIDVNLTNHALSEVTLALDNIALTRQSETDPVLSLPKLTVNDAVIDLNQQQVVLGEITLDGFNTAIRREIDGELDLMRLFAPDTGEYTSETLIPTPGHKPSDEARAQALAEAETITHSEETNAASAPEEDTDEQIAASEGTWETQIKRFQLTNASLRFEDATLTKVAPMTINSLDLMLDNIDLSGAIPVNLVLQATVNEHGSINTEGSLAWAPLATNLNIDLKAVDLVSLQGWAGNQLNVLLTKGDISFKGNVEADGEPLKVAVNGQGKLANFNIFDETSGIDLLHWKHLDINGIDVVSEPLRVEIDSVELGNFFAHVMLSSEGDLNLSKIVRQDDDQDTTAPEATETTPSTPSTTDEVMPIHIGKIILNQGRVNFNDQFIKPNYHANLTNLSGQIGPLNPNKSGKIDIRGAVDKTAPLEIKGSIAPFSTELLLDLAASVEDIDLPSFSPYSGKYFGRAIEKGKLSVNISYHIENGALSAENNIFLDQLTLGEDIDSPDAVSAPLGLAIALLKNRRGEIDIHLPIQGSLNDPQFSMSGIIFDAFINLITRAVTAPFSLLGSALGGDGEELSAINFEPGFSRIDTTAEKSLQTLSEVLIDRPSLKLEISGYTNPANDYEGLKLAILERKVKTQKLKIATKKGQAVGSLDDIELSPEKYSKYLELAYKEEKFEKPTNMIGLTKSLPDEEMEQLMLAHIEVDENDLEELAEQRASAAQNWVVNQGNIANDRVFIVREDDEEPGSQARFSLK